MDNDSTWERPIMLSPPPLEQHMQKSTTFPSHGERQMSVGYNLQQEFETLTAEFDLDLRATAGTGSNGAGSAGAGSNGTVDTPGGPSGTLGSSSSTLVSGSIANGTGASTGGIASAGASGGTPGTGLLAPSASKYGFSDLLGTSGSTPLTNSLLRDNLSPIQQPVPTNNLSLLLGGNNFLPPLASIPNRPQSVNDFSNYFNRQQQQDQPLLPQQTNFYLDLLAFTNWIENLNPQDNLTMVEYLCNNLPLDILLTFKSKLESHLSTHQAKSQSFLSPYQELYGDMENLNLGDTQSSTSSQPQLHQPKPKLKNNFTNQHLFIDQRNPRPKSADPSINNAVRYQQHPQPLQQPQQSTQPLQLQQQQFERARSPTSHLYEKTSFLQQAAANPNSPLHQQLHGHHYPQGQPTQAAHQPQPSSQSQAPSSQQTSSDDSLDLSAHTALKLGALATINSRVALDSNRKYGYGPYGSGHGTYQGGRPVHFEDSINRNVNSSSVPLPRTNPKSPGSKPSSGLSKKDQDLGNGRENLSGINSPNSASSSSNSSMPADVSNIELLNNIPAWLKLLRLHKYTDYLKDIPWRQLVEMSNEELEATGVVALGARRKLLKAFDVVKKANP